MNSGNYSSAVKEDFFQRPTLDVARDLLGMKIHRKIEGVEVICRIVETEGYLGVEDRAAHTFGGRRTSRNEVMYAPGGTMYVYLTYGLHYMMNFVTEEIETPCAILIRGVEPLTGWDLISRRRFHQRYEDLNSYQRKNLTNGPAKVTQALGIDLSDNSSSLRREDFFLTPAESTQEITRDRRIGIDYAQEARAYPYRFFITDNPYISKGVQREL